MNRLRPILGGLACLSIGVTGQAILSRAIRTLFERQGSTFHLFAFDAYPIWHPDWALLHGESAHAVMGVYGYPYPPPLDLLLAPIGLVSSQVANVVTVVLCVLLVLGVLLAWAARDGRIGWAAWPVVCSAPVGDLILQDQLASAVWLAGASLTLWAQWRRRWWLCGAAAAVACIRPDNALPLLAALLWITIRQPRALLKVVGGGLLLLGPLSLVCFIWNPAWPADYVHSVSLYQATGVFGLAKGMLGLAGPLLLSGLVCVAALLVVRRQTERISLDRGAVVMALTILAAPLEGLYSAAVVLPAVLRLARRPGLTAGAWVVALAPWAVVILLAPVLLGPDPKLAINLLPLTGLWMMAAVLVALLRPAAEPAHDEGRWRMLGSRWRPIGLRRTSPPR